MEVAPFVWFSRDFKKKKKRKKKLMTVMEKMGIEDHGSNSSWHVKLCKED